MGYKSTMQMIQRSNGNCQYYLICPAPLAQALEIEKGESMEWVIQDKHHILIKRSPDLNKKNVRQKKKGR